MVCPRCAYPSAECPGGPYYGIYDPMAPCDNCNYPHPKKTLTDHLLDFLGAMSRHRKPKR